MTRKIIIIICIVILNSNCSFDTKSGIWTKSEQIKKTTKVEDTILFKSNLKNVKEFNKNILITTPLNISKNKNPYSTNNFGTLYINDNFEKKSKYRFSKIKYFENFDPELVFDNKNLIFFDRKGSIIKFDDSSKILWKKNYYNKKEKKLLPILRFAINKNLLIVTDSLAKYYAVDLQTGDILWEKNHQSIFISEVKIDEDNFYVIDSNNILNCFSLKDGSKIWKFNSDNDFIKSQKKLSIVYDNKKVYFNNSRGDIYSLNKEDGSLAWLTPTRDDSESFQSFLLKNSKLVLDQDNLFFSNNKNTFFSLDSNTGIIKWTQNINSDLKPTIIENTILSITSDGYFFIIEKNTGKVIRITDILKGIKSKRKSNLSLSGFIAGSKNIYLSLNNGKILKIDIKTGRVISILKITRGKISKPFINNGKMFIIKDNEIIKLN